MSPLDRTLSAFGRTAIAVGLLLLAFAAFQLWGTGLAEARAQDELEAGFTARLAVADSNQPDERAGEADGDRIDDAAVVQGRTAGAMVPRSATASPEEGEPIATLHIPAIGLRKTVVEGTSRESLRSGPGHYQGTPLPGRPGNAAIAGHRTTHGAPFFDIDDLQPGDEIEVETVEGRFTYVVQGHDDGQGGQVGHLIVAPEEVWVIAGQGDNRLTLTACHPTYSARQRIVVTAVLAGYPAGAAPTVTEAHLAVDPIPEVETVVGSGSIGADAPPASLAEVSRPTAAMTEAAEGLGWQRSHAGGTFRWAAATAVIAVAAHVVGRWWRRLPAYAVASPAFGLALFTCFTHLDRLLPAA